LPWRFTQRFVGLFFVEGRSQREAARVFGLSRETVSKMCRFSLPPGYTRAAPASKPKLGPLLGVIDAILAVYGGDTPGHWSAGILLSAAE
jgi:hypothetical protein